MPIVPGDGEAGKNAIYGWESQVRHEREEVKEQLDRIWSKEMRRKQIAKAEHSMREAAKTGDEVTVRALIDSGVDVNAVGGTYGQTPLHYAAREGRTNVVICLINAGAVSLALLPSP